MPNIVYPGLASTVIPLWELSGNLMVDFGRSDKSKVNDYSRVTPVKSVVGNYLRFNPKDIARMTSLTQSTKWAPGTPRPTGNHNTIGFQTMPFRTDRDNRGITLDKRTTDISSFPIMKTHTRALGQWATTYRAYRTCKALTTTSNFDATHVVSATTASGAGFLDAGTTADPRIKKAFDYASRLIQADTFGAVQFGMLRALMNNTTAQKLSASRELREYVMQQAGAQGNITGRDKAYNTAYGLPEYLYDYKVVIEDFYYNADNRGGTEAATPVMPDNTIVILAVDGDLEQPAGGTSYSTCHTFAYEEMTLETKDDTWNRLVEMSCTMDIAVEIVAPPTGVILTNIFS